MEKGFFGGQTNKKWGLVFIWGDILEYFFKTYGINILRCHAIGVFRAILNPRSDKEIKNIDFAVY